MSIVLGVIVNVLGVIVIVYCYQHSYPLLPFVLFHRLYFLGSKKTEYTLETIFPIKVGVGYSDHFLGHVRIVYFHFFSFTVDVLINRFKKIPYKIQICDILKPGINLLTGNSLESIILKSYYSFV